jgi:hypothetical protein
MATCLAAIERAELGWAAAALAVLLAAGLWIRFRPFRDNPLLGVDNWYWLLCAEGVKTQRRLPPKLPYFMLEIEEQWYPPLYGGLLALLPMRLLERHGGRVSQAVDLLHAVAIFLGVLWVGGGPAVALLAGLSYALAFFLVQSNTQLQPRGLAGLLLTLAVLGVWWYAGSGRPAVWVGLVALSVVLLLLHKMTTQMWAVYLAGFSLWAGDWTILAILPASVAAATLLTGGFYLKVLRGHWDIVSYWHKNIRQLGSHQYYESPRYRKPGFASTALHRPGWRNVVTKAWSLCLYNVFMAMLPVLVYAAFLDRPAAVQGRLESFLWWWLGMTYLWGVLTTFVPYFTALGAGVSYLLHGFFPLMALAGLLVPGMPRPLQAAALVLWGLALAFSGLSYGRFLKSAAASRAGASYAELRAVLDCLKGLPKDGVLCIPLVLSDPTAYWARKKVLWGGHSYGFRRMLQPYFPVMDVDLAETLRAKPVSYVLFKRGYLDSLAEIGLVEGTHIRRIHAAGEHELYEVIRKEA